MAETEKCTFECMNTTRGLCDYTGKKCEETEKCDYRGQCGHCDNKLNCTIKNKGKVK